MRAGLIVVFACLLFLSCGSSESVGVPDQGDTSITTTLKENVADSVPPSAPVEGSEDFSQSQPDEGTDDATTDSDQSNVVRVDDGEVGATSSTTVTTSTSIAPPSTVDLDTVVPEELDILTEEPHNDSGLFGTDEPGSSA